MPPDRVCRTVHQYSKEPVSDEDMQKLQEIAADYIRVKNYVYARFGGTGSLSKLYPGYTVQNEMTQSGLRKTLEMPSVYFYLAVFDALRDIKSQWTKTKTRILKQISRNVNFTEEEKHYLRFLLKIHDAFTAVLNQTEINLPQTVQKTCDDLASQVNVEKLHRYLCRQTRKFHVRLYTDAAEGFSVSERAYRYDDHGIYIAVKEKRKRIFIPLTDNNRYQCQIYLRLYPKQKKVCLHVPIRVTVKHHPDYTKQTGIAFGIHTMLTTDEGHCYGKELGKYQTEYADWIRMQTGIYNKNRSSNPGRKKYSAKKSRLTGQMHSYMNCELNKFLQEEKPQIIYIVRLPEPKTGGVSPTINYSVSMWQRGYIRRRLLDKCEEQSIKLVEVMGKDISRECSCCGAAGVRKSGVFVCPSCGYTVEEKTNTAGNIKKRGMEGKTLN